jgi:transcriptional regulator with XRE-family HTH domain
MSGTAIGHNIKRLRLARGMSQFDLSKHVGVHPQTIWRWENGTLPEAEHLPKLAGGLRCKIEDLYREDAA